MRKLLIIISVVLLGNALFSQCYPDRHNTTWYDGWVSCEAAINPNPERPFSHWIMFDLGKQYQLGQLHIWNSNDPRNLDFGLKEIVIDYSTDAIDWKELGYFELDPGPGKNIYEGTDVVDFEMAKARYVLITAESNYGGDCFGLAEVRFELDSTASAVDELSPDNNNCLSLLTYPNPFYEEVNVQLESACNDDIYFTVTDEFGRIVVPRQTAITGNDGKLDLNSGSWNPGVYFIIVGTENRRVLRKLVKTGK